MTRRMVLLMIAVVLGLLAGTASASPTTVYTVNTTADSLDTGGCGSSQVCSLRDAVAAADQSSSSSTIAVPAGTYSLTPPATGAENLDISTSQPVTITGAGSGFTIIDAGGTDRALTVESGASLTLQGVTVQHGTPASGAGGGAIDVHGAFTAIGDVFTLNQTLPGGQGGAIFDDAPGALTVRNSTFTSNSTDGQGGAVAETGAGVLTMTHVTFGTHGAPNGDGNTAAQQGGAVYDDASSAATIDDSTFTGNHTTGGTSGGGGALWLNGHGYTLDRDQFAFNATTAAGGAILWLGGGELRSSGSSFVANSAGTQAGAIGATATATQPLSLTNVTVDSNTAATGGALGFAGSTPVDLVNDTFFNDAAGDHTDNEIFGAEGLRANTGGVQNSIIGNDNPPGVSGAACSTPLPVGVDLGHNLATDASCLSGASGDRPSTALTLGTPANNGATVLTDAEPAGAPTIDAGATVSPACPGADARRVSRPQGSACDIGAYEFVAPPTPPATSTTTVTSPGATTTTTVTARTSTPGPGPGTPPIATTRGVLGTRSTSAFLGGTVNAHNQPTSYMFQVGTTRFYGLVTVTGHTDVAVLSVDTLVPRLKPSTRYHYRLVATNAAGTSYGADRTFTTAPAYDGAIKLAATTLTVHGGKVSVPLNCASTKACGLRFTITITARLARTRKLGTLSFTRTTNTLVTLRPHRTTTVSAAVNPAALALLETAPHRRLAGKLSTRPRTNQLGLISTVTLALK